MNAGFIGDIYFSLPKSSQKVVVSLQNTSNGQKFLACTHASSKWFKTFKGAEKWMNSRGFYRV